MCGHSRLHSPIWKVFRNICLASDECYRALCYRLRLDGQHRCILSRRQGVSFMQDASWWRKSKKSQPILVPKKFFSQSSTCFPDVVQVAMDGPEFAANAEISVSWFNNNKDDFANACRKWTRNEAESERRSQGVATFRWIETCSSADSTFRREAEKVTQIFDCDILSRRLRYNKAQIWDDLWVYMYGIDWLLSSFISHTNRLLTKLLDGPPLARVEPPHPSLTAFELVHKWEAVHDNDFRLGIVVMFSCTLLLLILMISYIAYSYDRDQYAPTKSDTRRDSQGVMSDSGYINRRW